MIDINLANDWFFDVDSVGFVLTRSISISSHRMTVLIEGWTRNVRNNVSMIIKEAGIGPIELRKLPIAWINDVACAFVTVPTEFRGTVELSAPCPAKRVTWRSTKLSVNSAASDAVIPKCLHVTPNICAEAPSIDRFQSLKALISTGELKAVLNELGQIGLGGSREDTVIAATLILRDLAKHPFRRDPLIGAILGALSFE